MATVAAYLIVHVPATLFSIFNLPAIVVTDKYIANGIAFRFKHELSDIREISYSFNDTALIISEVSGKWSMITLAHLSSPRALILHLRSIGFKV